MPGLIRRADLRLTDTIDEKTDNTTGRGSVGQSRLPHGRNELLASARVVDTEAVKEGGLTIVGTDDDAKPQEIKRKLHKRAWISAPPRLTHRNLP